MLSFAIWAVVSNWLIGGHPFQGPCPLWPAARWPEALTDFFHPRFLAAMENMLFVQDVFVYDVAHVDQ
jgi:hypothetical protein